MKDRTKRRVKDRLLSFLVVIAVIAALFVAVGILALLKDKSCDRLDAQRVSHLQPGHDAAGPAVDGHGEVRRLQIRNGLAALVAHGSVERQEIESAAKRRLCGLRRRSLRETGHLERHQTKRAKQNAEGYAIDGHL